MLGTVGFGAAGAVAKERLREVGKERRYRYLRKGVQELQFGEAFAEEEREKR